MVSWSAFRGCGWVSSKATAAGRRGCSTGSTSNYEWVGRHEVPELRRKPSEYFRTNCFLAVEADEEPVRSYVEWFGDDNLVFSTDSPHADSKYPRAVASFRKLPLSEGSQRKILWDNWRRLYDIGRPKPPS